MGVSVRLTAIDVSDFALPASRRSVLGRGTHAPRAHRVVVMCLQSGARLGRCFVHTVGLFAALCMVQAQPVTAQSELVKSTVAYREVEGHKILADVYRPAGDDVRPVVVWLHGGALVFWNREYIHSEVRALAEENGYALVSFDYRLAPETKLPGIISDGALLATSKRH